MSYGNNRNYRGSGYRSNHRSGGYRAPSSSRSSRGVRGTSSRRRKNTKRTRNRVIIIACLIVILALIIALVSTMFNCVCGTSKPLGSTEETATSATQDTRPSQEAKKKEKTTEALTFNAPNIDDDKKSKGVNDGGIYVWNEMGFELFYGDESMGQRYAKYMNNAKKKLGSGINVYSMIIPNHTEMGLPSRLKNVNGGATTLSQADFIKSAYDAFDGVKYINVYNDLSAHCNDYIYFGSDHHWTALGGYYAYTAFAKQTNQKAISLDECEKKMVDGFTGSFIKLTSEKISADTVYYWDFPYDITSTITGQSVQSGKYDGVYYPYAAEGENTYGLFLYGDNPLEVIKSSSDAAGKEKILVIHESYGNAFVPYLTYNYSEIHSIDFRSFRDTNSEDLKTYCEKNGIKNVLFVNGVMSAATAEQLDKIEALLK